MGGLRRWPRVGPLPQSYSEALAQLLDRLAVHRAVLVGHSLGAIIAARFAATNPGRVAGLALISPAVGYRTPVGAPLPDNVRARIDDFVRLGAKDFAAARAPEPCMSPSANPMSPPRSKPRWPPCGFPAMRRLSACWPRLDLRRCCRLAGADRRYLRSQ